MVPSPGLLLDHVPGPEASDNGIVYPTHTGVFPRIAEGEAITLTVAVVKQPPGSV